MPDGGLYDVVDGGHGDDSSMRPNQLLAWSLPYAPLAAAPEPLARVAAQLLTPLGLRSLSPEAPGYQPLHRGDSAARDSAYHQGTVWPWLIGPYVEAQRRTGAVDTTLLTDIAAHLSEFGLLSVSETADGQPPHAGTGCPFQAWSVAQVLRACTAMG
jgi:glycogen debranching enzyme